MVNHSRRSLVVLPLALSLRSGHASNSYPNRPVRIIVPFAPGASDIVIRAIAEQARTRFEQPIVIENKPGGGTLIGTESVAKSAPDGYTLLFTSTTFTINSTLLRDKLPYKPDELLPVAATAYHPFVLLVNPSFPANTAKELINVVRANPGKYTFASPGRGSSHEMVMELLKRENGLDVLHVPYKGSVPALSDVASGQVSMMFNGPAPALSFIRTGKLRPIAVEGLARLPILPEVPTFRESGIPGLDRVSTWSGVFSPSGTPAQALEFLSKELTRAVGSPEISKRFNELGLQPAAMESGEFARFIQNDTATWARLIQSAGITAG